MDNIFLLEIIRGCNGMLQNTLLRVIKFHILQSGFDLLFKCLTLPIEPLINLSETLILSINITFTPTHNFNFEGRLAV